MQRIAYVCNNKTISTDLAEKQPKFPSLSVLSSLLFIGASSFWHPQILSAVIAYLLLDH